MEVDLGGGGAGTAREAMFKMCGEEYVGKRCGPGREIHAHLFHLFPLFSPEHSQTIHGLINYRIGNEGHVY